MTAPSPTSDAMPLAQAARELGIDPVTLQRWIKRGCPVMRLGAKGRGRSSVVSVAAIRTWRAENDLNVIAAGLTAAFFRGNSGEPRPVWQDLNIDRGKAALLFAEAFKSIHRELLGSEPIELPAPLQNLHEIALSVLSRRISKA